MSEEEFKKETVCEINKLKIKVKGLYTLVFALFVFSIIIFIINIYL